MHGAVLAGRLEGEMIGWLEVDAFVWDPCNRLRGPIVVPDDESGESEFQVPADAIKQNGLSPSLQ